MATVTKTIGASGADYTTIQAWINDLDDGTNAAINTTAYQSGDVAVGELLNEDFTISSTITGAAQGETVGLSKAILTVASGAEHNGVPGGGARLLCAAITHAIDLDIDGYPFVLDGFEIDFQGNSARGGVKAGGGSGQRLDIHRCMLHGISGAQALMWGLIDTGGGRTHFVTNNIVYDITQTAGGDQEVYGLSTSDSSNATVWNNTVYGIRCNSSSGPAVGIQVADVATTSMRNNIAMGTAGTSSGTKNDFGGSYTLATVSNNLSGDATAPGAGSVTSETATNVLEDPTGSPVNLHLKAGSAAIGAGADLGTTETVNLDVDGRDRDAEGDTWDIGADQTVAAADETAPTYDTVPQEDSVTATTITVDATASDAVSATVNHYAVAVADAATAPSAAQVKAGNDSTDSAALASGSDLAVTSGAEGSITLTGLDAATPYDVYYVVEDESANLTTVTKIDSATSSEPIFSVPPALDAQTHNSVTVTATAADETDATVDHYAVVVANNAPTPNATQIAAGQDSTGAAAISAGSDLAVTNDVEGSITLTGLTVSTNYDVWYTVGDSGPTYATPQKVDFKTRPLVVSATVGSDGVTVVIVFTENMSFGAGGSDGFALATPTAALAYSSGEGTDTVTFTASSTVLDTDTPTLGYTQPDNGWEGDLSIVDLASFSGQAVTNNSTQTGAGSPTATAGEASDIPGGVITFALGNFTNAPTGATLNGIAVSIANATTSSVDVTLPALSDFAVGEAHATTRWQVAQTVQITDSASSDTASDTIEIDPPEISGSTYWFGTLTGVAEDAKAPPEAEAGDEYFVEETAGAISNVSSTLSIEATTPEYAAAIRIFDVSAASWSAIVTESWDGTAPTLSTAVIPAAGTTVVLTFDEAVTQGSGYLDSDWTLNATDGAATLTYVSGDGTTEHTFTPSRVIGSHETVTLDWAGTGLEDAVGNDVATFSGQAVTNESTQDTAPPSGYAVSIDQAAIDADNDDALTFTFSGAEVGASYAYSISSSGGGTPVAGSGTISTATDQIGPVNVTSLPDGTLTLSVTLTDTADNEGQPAEDTVVKDTGLAPSGYGVTIDQASINPTNETALSFTFDGAEIGATYAYSITSDGGAGEVSDSGVIGSATDQITGIDVSSLPDGTLTLSVTLTNEDGEGAPATDTVDKDTVAPSGYSVAIDQATVNAGNDDAFSFTFADAEVGAGYAYGITSTGGGGQVTGSGTISTATDQISGIDVTSLPDGTLMLSVTLTDADGNEGTAATDTVGKDTVAPSGYAVVIDQADINENNVTALTFTFSGAQVGADYAYSISSSGGGTPVADTGTVSTATAQIGPLDVTGLGDGTLTLSFTLTDPAGNEGAAAEDTVSKETVDNTPDAFDLGALGGQDRSVADLESNLITVSGLGQTVDVTLTGDSSAEYQKNGGLWATAPTTADNTDTFKVRVDSSGAYNAVTFATLTIGDLSDTFSVTTIKDPALELVGAAPLTRLHSRR